MIENTHLLQTKLPGYQDVLTALQHIKAIAGPCETHGMLCGFICAGKEMDGVAWAEPMFSGIEASDCVGQASRQLLLELYNTSYQQLQEMDFAFRMLLPDDEQDLRLRAQELSLWCRGFVSGLSLAGVDIDDLELVQRDYSEDMLDALIRFSELSRIDYDILEIDDEDEASFIEVSEYIRMAVVFVYGELAVKQGIKPKFTIIGDRLH